MSPKRATLLPLSGRRWPIRTMLAATFIAMRVNNPMPPVSGNGAAITP